MSFKSENSEENEDFMLFCREILSSELDPNLPTFEAVEKKLKEDLKLNVLFTKKHIDDNNELYEKMYDIWITIKDNLNKS